MKLYYQLKKGHQGDKEAVEYVYLKFYPIIKRISKGLDYKEGETDLTIAFLEVIQNIDFDNFPKNEGQITNFLCKLLKNKAVDLFRKNVIGRQDDLCLDYDLLHDENFDLDSNVFISSLISSLSPIQRNVIIKKFIYQYTDIEISRELGISRQAVNRTKNRALNSLRKKLDKENES